MKRNIFSKCLYGMMALGLLASCSNEPLLEDTNGGILENETTTYVRISLLGEGITSRADEPGYESGTADESAVKSLILAFFDNERKFIRNQQVDMTKATVLDGNGNTVEKIITVVTPVNLQENDSKPAWVVAFVNPTQAYSDLEFGKLEDVMTRTRLRSQVSHLPGSYRTMNNSVYFDETTGYVRYATAVNFEDQFYLSENEAKAANANSIEITVERVEAKVKVNLPSNDNIKPVAANEYKLQFVPQAWFVNATEKRTFLIKNYRSERTNYTTDEVTLPEDLKTYFMSYSFLNGAFGTGAQPFNSNDNKRSFWAIDPTYFDGDHSDDFYPDVSYDVKYGQINTGGKDYNLLYRSYDDAVNEYKAAESTNYVKFSGTTKTHEYVLENTMSLNTLKSTDAMASITSVELIGYYIVKDADDNIVFNGKTDTDIPFYIRHEGSASSPSYKFMNGDNEAIDYFLEHASNFLYVQRRYDDGSAIENQYEILSAGHLSENNPDVSYGVSYSDFGLIYPEDTKISEQWRTLTINKGEDGKYNQNIFIYDATTNTYRNITDADIEDLASHFYNTFGVVERFKGGKAHFTVPLKHLWNENYTSNKFDPKKVKLGSYGVVRNHIYELTIGKIEGLGSGIGDPRQPIVPPTDNQQYYISTKLNILKWRQVSQSVDL